MASIKISRNIVLTLKDHFETYLTNDGYSFTFVSTWPADDKIVKPEDYVADQGMLALPAGRITVQSRILDQPLEIGGGSRYESFPLNVFIHAITGGQLSDLMDVFYEALTDTTSHIGDKIITIKDFSSTGYPSALAPDLFDMEVLNVTLREAGDFGSQNLALQYAGSISFTGQILRSL